MALTLGKVQKLKIARKVPNGYFLSDGEDEVLLPMRELEKEPDRDDELQVLVYKNTDDELRATLKKPLVEVDNMAVLEVVDKTEYGDFLDWGIDKDILLPKRNQSSESQVGDKKLVYIMLDEKSDRLVASEKIEAFLDNSKLYLEPKEKVEIIAYRGTPIGYEVIINGVYKGLLHYSDAWMDIELYQPYEATIKHIREDHKIDVLLGERGYGKIEKTESLILKLLDEAGGFLPFHDKSSPDEIKDYFQMSKKTFKKSLGSLYKQGLISLKDDGIEKTS